MNKILLGDSWQLASNLEDNSVDCVVTSPPYWGLRDYGTGSWEGGKSDCDHTPPNAAGETTTVGNNLKGLEHTFKQQCGKCDAKRIDLQAGLEEHPQQWVDKMVELCELIKPKLKKTGVMFWNIGETYFGSGGAGGDYNK